MASAPVQDRLLSRSPTGRRPLSASDVAWISVVPSAVVILAAIVLLAPPLGHALPTPGPEDALWPPGMWFIFGEPEPVKQVRFLIALLGPLLLAAAILAGSRRSTRLRPVTLRGLVVTSQALLLVFLACALLGQRNIIFHHAPEELSLPPYWGIFPTWVVVAAAALALAIPAALRRRQIAGWIGRYVPDTAARRTVCLVAAGLLTVCWLLPAINTEGSIGNTGFSELPPWAMGDTLAVLNGRTPLVNFYALYGQLWAYVAVVPLAAFGATITVFSIVMTSISALALLAVYDLFRRIVHSSLLGLLLFLPFLASGFLTLPVAPERIARVHATSWSNSQIFSVWPMRYAGPYLLAWLLVRHLQGAAPRRRWPLFLLAGLVAINNLEFGAGAVLGTLVVLLVSQSSHSWRAIARLAVDAAGGVLAAGLLVALLTFAHSGALPDFSFLLAYPRIFSATGLTNWPMPTVGVHLAVYATLVAAIGTAVVRLVRREEDAALTGMLLWSGIFGLGAASYFVGRSDTYKLVALFSACCLALALLVVVVMRSMAARGWRRPGLAELVVLWGFGLAIASLRELPAPWSQIARLERTTAAPLYDEAAITRFIEERTVPGEHVVILMRMGHRIARSAGVVNVTPYSFMEAIVTLRQMRTLIAAMQREHVHSLFISPFYWGPAYAAMLEQAGFVPRDSSPAGVIEVGDGAALAD